MNIDELNRLYEESETNTRKLFAEQRSNVKLVAGEHYNKTDSHFWREIRRTEGVNRKQKLRLTKNHIQKITKTIKNNILVHSPSVTVGPRNDSEVQDRKAAQMNDAVWKDLKDKNKFNRRVREFLDDFVDIGELFVELEWDPDAGDILGYEPILDEYGEPTLDENGEVATQPVFSGKLIWNRTFGFNVLTDQTARSYEESQFVCVRKMSAIRPLMLKYKDDEEKTKFIQESSKSTYKIFDNNTGSYQDSKGLVMIRTYYFRPTYEYPTGYYYITTEFGILEEGKIPLGDKVFPVLKAGYDDLSTSARSQSVIKQLRPYQAEINRTASKMAEHQITLGDDKIITQAGATLSSGATKHGIKHIKVSGPDPKILPGRSGEQYLGYMNSTIAEMYQISGVMEESMEQEKNIDPYALLFRSASQKKKFVMYSTKFEEFLIDLCDASLRYKKAFMVEDELIPIVGRNEYVNVAEFKSSTDLHYQIKIEAQAQDIETRLGRQMALTQTLQYAGASLDKNDIGKLVRAMPYLNGDKIVDELTIDHDNAENDILALDRGEYPQSNPYDNHKYIIQKLVHRMKQPDFRYLDPMIQQNYERKKQEHTQIDAQMEAEKIRAMSGFIPSGGYMVACDFYVSYDPDDPSKTKRLRIPSESLDWLVKKLQEQGSSQEQLQQMGDRSSTDLMLEAVNLSQPQGQRGAQGASPQPVS